MAQDNNNKIQAWIGFDLDATLAEYKHWSEDIGKPIQPMVETLKQELARGEKENFIIKIYTARVWPLGTFEANKKSNEGCVRQAEAQYNKIQEWCQEVFGRVFPVTCIKDMGMIYCYDDRVKQVAPNEGVILEQAYNELVALYQQLETRVRRTARVAKAAIRTAKAKGAGEN